MQNEPLQIRPEEDGIWKTLNTEWAMNHWHQKGAPKDKLLIGKYEDWDFVWVWKKALRQICTTLWDGSRGAKPNFTLPGLAAYGRTWNLGWGKDKAKTAKVGQSANGGGKAGPYLKEGGVLSYYEICEKVTKENAKVRK